MDTFSDNKFLTAGFWGIVGVIGWLTWKTFRFMLVEAKIAEAALIVWMSLLFLYTIKYEKESVLAIQSGSLRNEQSTKHDACNFLAVIAGTYATFWLNHVIGLGGVVASSMVGMAAGLLFPRFASPIFCGSFVGMACNIIFSHPAYLMLAGVLSAGLYVSTEEMFQGIGGKLGTIAFFGTYTASFLLERPLRTVLPVEMETISALFLWTSVAGLVTFLLKERGNLNGVTASSAVGLWAGLVLPSLYPETGTTLSVAAFCATFTGMSATSRIGGTAGMAGGVLLTSTLFVLAYPLFDGAGGKLGAIAFFSSASIAGLRLLMLKVKQKYRKPLP